MKKNTLFIVVFSCFMNCNAVQKETISFSIEDVDIMEYTGFGEKVSAVTIYNKNVMTETYKGLKEGDTINVAFLSTVNDVCEVKGCWMKIDLDAKEEATIRFKDYSFFVPLDLERDTVIVQGSAFVSETSVADLKHLAEDAGKSAEEITLIMEPKMTYSFVADGVLIKK